MANHSIQGKTVLIAGGAKNLGGLIALDLAKQGAKAVAVHYNSAVSKGEADKTVAAIEKAGAKAVALQANLTTAAAVEKLFADTMAAVGRPDIAINTVGKVLKKPMTEISEAEYDEMTAVNSKTRIASRASVPKPRSAKPMSTMRFRSNQVAPKARTCCSTGCVSARGQHGATPG